VYCDRFPLQESFYFQTGVKTTPSLEGWKRIAFDLDMPTDEELWPADVIAEARQVNPEDD
jgi:hypothetical protein